MTSNKETNKEIIVIGDIEMGAGNLTDDFIADKALSSLIQELAQRPQPVDLILNGDTFDFLKCPSTLKPKTHYPRHVTEEISVAKLRLIHKAHQPVFDALRIFLAVSGKNIYFIVGNHDHDLVYEEVQREIKKMLVNQEQVHFPGLSYREGDVYVEHGHQYDFFFKANFEKLFLKHKGETFLNLPYVSFGLLGPFMRLKEANPFIERIFPRPALLTHHRVMARKLNKETISYFLKSMLFYPFRFYSDPSYTFPSGIIREFYKRLRTLHWDVGNVTAAFMKQSRVQQHIVVLGHIHEKRLAQGRKKIVIHPGSWRDEYDFDPKTRELIPRSKRYVRIEVGAGRPQYTLVDLPMLRSIWGFDEVIKDELAYIRLAAREEGYTTKG